MSKEDELVLVVSRELVVPKHWRGINKEGITDFGGLVRNHGSFKRRGDVEENQDWKQIIPYLVFRYRDRYLLMQRTDQGGEERLYNKYSLGIGGHIRKEDVGGENVLDWAMREFREEMNYSGSYVSSPLGLLNDDSDPVGKVHLGYVILLEGDSDEIQIRDEHQSGKLHTIGEMKEAYPHMENWSQMVYDFLI